jgi:hypothetical protein
LIAGVSAGGDHDEAPVLHVERGGVLALEAVGDQVAGPGLDLHQAEVGRRAGRVRRAGPEARRTRRLLEVRQPRDLP